MCVHETSSFFRKGGYMISSHSEKNPSLRNVETIRNIILDLDASM